jgi:hypothetical protein
LCTKIPPTVETPTHPGRRFRPGLDRRRLFALLARAFGARGLAFLLFLHGVSLVRDLIEARGLGGVGLPAQLAPV